MLLPHGPPSVEPTLIGYSGRVFDPRRRDTYAQTEAEVEAMLVVALLMGAHEVLYTGQGTRKGNPWDFELFYRGDRRDLGEHVLYTDGGEGPDNPILQTGIATAWDPDADFRKMLATSAAVKKHVWRVSAWRTSRLDFAKSHLVIETHSIVPSVDMLDAFLPVERADPKTSSSTGDSVTARSALTYGEVGDIDFLWILSKKSMTGLIWTNQTWFPIQLQQVLDDAWRSV